MAVEHELELVRARQLGTSGKGRQVRLDAGLSLREMAAWVGVDASTLLRWESGAHAPSRRHALRWQSVVAQIQSELAQPWLSQSQKGTKQ